MSLLLVSSMLALAEPPEHVAPQGVLPVASVTERLRAIEEAMCRANPPESINPRSGTAHARAERNAGRRYLLGVYSFSVWVPGAGEDPEKWELPVRLIEGAIDGMSCIEYRERAVAYAKRFNRVMLRP